jgi:hypothetical protein
MRRIGMTLVTTTEPTPTTDTELLVDISELITDLGDAAAMTQGPNGSGSDGKRYLYQ